MQHMLNLPGFEGRQIAIEEAGWFSGAKLLLDGQPAAKGAKRGEYLLRRNDGRDALARLKIIFLDPVPVLLLEGQTIRVAEPLQWYQWVWCGLPILLVAAGGCIGGLFGGLAIGVNVRIFRMKMNPALQFLLTGAVSGVALVIVLVLAVILALALKDK
jgi:hypothetical protein